MDCTMNQLRRKEVINSRNGCRIGFVDDVSIDVKTACVQSIIIYGRLKLLGILGRHTDCIIPWDKISLIGEDTILVDFSGEFAKKHSKKGRFPKFF